MLPHLSLGACHMDHTELLDVLLQPCTLHKEAPAHAGWFRKMVVAWLHLQRLPVEDLVRLLRHLLVLAAITLLLLLLLLSP
jgi:hypothetical protein